MSEQVQSKVANTLPYWVDSLLLLDRGFDPTASQTTFNHPELPERRISVCRSWRLFDSCTVVVFKDFIPHEEYMDGSSQVLDELDIEWHVLHYPGELCGMPRPDLWLELFDRATQVDPLELQSWFEEHKDCAKKE